MNHGHDGRLVWFGVDAVLRSRSIALLAAAWCPAHAGPTPTDGLNPNGSPSVSIQPSPSMDGHQYVRQRPHARTPTRRPSTNHMTHDVSEAKRINRSTSATLVHTSPYILSLTMLQSPRIMRRASPVLSSTLTACSTSLHVAPSANRWAYIEPSGWTTGTMGDSCGLVSTLGSVHDRSAHLLL